MEEKQRKDIAKKFVLNFFNGCDYRKCLSPDCKNFIIRNPELDLLRNEKKEGFDYVSMKLVSK